MIEDDVEAYISNLVPLEYPFQKVSLLTVFFYSNPESHFEAHLMHNTQSDLMVGEL